MNYQDLFTGCATLLFLALFIVAAVPDLCLWMARSMYAHQFAMRTFWAWQVAAFQAYGKEFRRAAQEARES